MDQPDGARGLPTSGAPWLRKIVITSIGALSTVLADRQLDSLMRTFLSDVRAASSKAVNETVVLRCSKEISSW